MKIRIFWKVKKIKILIQKVYFDFEKKKKLKFLQDKAQKKHSWRSCTEYSNTIHVSKKLALWGGGEVGKIPPS